MAKIILATSSPYRREAFGSLGLEFESEGSDINEQFEGRPEKPEELVAELARLKAEAVATGKTGAMIIGFDSVGLFNDAVFEKPKSREEACQRLKDLSGNSHEFFTGIHIINLENGRVSSKVVRTTVRMRMISDSEIDMYLDQDPGFNTYALGYDPIGHYNMSFIENLEGSYNNFLRGIPVEVIMGMLFEVGYKLPGNLSHLP